MIIAVDFDGTLCESAWPAIGAPKQYVIDFVLNQQQNGAKLILWTNRTGERLNEAVAWCEERGIIFTAVNENLPEMIALYGGDCRKVFADVYLDDKAIPLTAHMQAQIVAATALLRYTEETSLPQLAQLAGPRGTEAYKQGLLEGMRAMGLAIGLPQSALFSQDP